MDELCKLLVDKLGIVADSSISWLQTAIPQYAEMMAIQTTVYAALSVTALVATFVALFVSWSRVEESDAIAIVGIACVFLVLLFGCVAFFYVPDAICWHVTPDAMLLRELVGTVA